jgi:hypothetical protein
MKISLIFLFSVLPTSLYADGYRCTGENFNARLYNYVNRAEGTKNPAVLIASENLEEKGNHTIARLEGDEIEKVLSLKTVAFEGQVNSSQTGRFVFVRLEVNKRPYAVLHTRSNFKELYHANLIVNRDGASTHEEMLCTRYRKK